MLRPTDGPLTGGPREKGEPDDGHHLTGNEEQRGTDAAPGRQPRPPVPQEHGGLGVAGVLAVLGTATMSNATYSHDFVTRQLVQQRITFKPVDALIDAERNEEPARCP